MSRKANAFTLVELLVVVAIIALLLGILMPALNKAKLLAANTVCLSHLHQLGYAFITYGADNRDYIPAARAERGHTWNNMLGYGGYDGRSLESDVGVSSGIPIKELSSHKLYTCPLIPQNKTYVEAAYKIPQGIKKLSTGGTTATNYRRGPYQDWNTLVTVNVYLTGNEPWSMRLSDCTEPAQDILLADMPGGELGFKNGEWTRPGYIGNKFINNPQWHAFDMKLNVLLPDGHSENIDFRDTYNTANTDLMTGQSNGMADTRTTDWDWRD